MGDRELQTAAVQVIALSKVVAVVSTALQAAHVFIDVVTGEESESVLSKEDAELAEIIHQGILDSTGIVQDLGEDMVAALATIAEMPESQIALAADLEGSGQSPIAEDVSKIPGQYL